MELKYKEAENLPQNCTTVLEQMFCALLGVADHFTVKNEQVYLFSNTKKKKKISKLISKDQTSLTSVSEALSCSTFSLLCVDCQMTGTVNSPS